MAKHSNSQDGARGRRKKEPVDIFKEDEKCSDKSRVLSGTAPVARTRASLFSKTLEVEVADFSKEFPPEAKEAAAKLVSSLDVEEEEKGSRSQTVKTKRSHGKMKIKHQAKLDPATKEELDRIWDSFSEGKIDVGYAVVGKTMLGQFIVDYDLLVETLISYGFTMNPVLEFIDEYNAQLKSGKVNGPLVMLSYYKWNIQKNVKPLKD